MDEIEQSNKLKILKELQKNGRASLSELSNKTGLSRQTIAKTIKNMEKKKQIWGYSSIFDLKIINKKLFIFLVKLDLSKNTEDFLKKAIDPNMIKENENFGFMTSMFLHGKSDLLVMALARDIIDAKKLMNNYKKIFEPNIKEIDLFEVIATFRDHNVLNPNVVNEWKNLLY